ncbi:MAG: methyltransferase domain-containing protein [Bryobacteraceae bacterium]
MRLIPLLFLICMGSLFCVPPGLAQTEGEQAYTAFLAWRNAPGNKPLAWEAATAKYQAKLLSDGLTPKQAERILSIVTSRDEGAYYDPVYAQPTPTFPTAPSKLLMDAVAGRKPGKALDVGMGQGRNSVFLAKQGWDVTGFDTSKVGVEQARKAAAEAQVRIRALHASDQEFDFGVEQWDLIAILYPIEKRSVFRVQRALKPGGIVVVECSHKEGANAPFEYGTNELLRIFEGFRVVSYEDRMGWHEWARKNLRMVRFIAQKSD